MWYHFLIPVRPTVSAVVMAIWAVIMSVASPAAELVLLGGLIFLSRAASAVVSVVSPVVRALVATPAAVISTPSVIALLVDALISFFGRCGNLSRTASTMVTVVARAIVMAITAVITSPFVLVDGQVGRGVHLFSFFGRIGQGGEKRKGNLFQKYHFISYVYSSAIEDSDEEYTTGLAQKGIYLLTKSFMLVGSRVEGS